MSLGITRSYRQHRIDLYLIGITESSFSASRLSQGLIFSEQSLTITQSCYVSASELSWTKQTTVNFPEYFQLCFLICMPPTREFVDRTQVLCCFPTMMAFTYKLMTKTIISLAENWGDLIIKSLHMQRKHRTRKVVLAFLPTPTVPCYSNKCL